MTEAKLCELIIEACGFLGLLVHWCRDSRQCEGHKGFPDLMIIGPAGLIIRECKSADGEMRAEQDLWAWAIDRAGSHGQDGRKSPLWGIWRPEDWPDAIYAELHAIS